MKDLSISEDIVPLAQFKAQASHFLRRLATERHPLVITQNGRPAGVLLLPAEYDRMRETQRFLESVTAGVSDAEAGRVMDTAELRSRLTMRRKKAIEG